VQEEQLRAGARPTDPGFGVEPSGAWGLLGTDENAAPAETEPGRYVEFYERMERAIRARKAATGAAPGEGATGAAAAEGAAHAAAPAEGAAHAAAPAEGAAHVPPPVPLAAGIATLRVIEAARASSAERVVVPL
jgi:hypothetical protein